MSQPIDRRTFLQVIVAAGGGLLLGIGFVDDAEAQQAPDTPPFSPGAYVRISPEGRITLYSKSPEIGQGIKTAFALIIAEELDAKWSDVTVEQSAIDAAVYGSQAAGGSRSIPTNWMTLRQAGAGARAMLLSAAAQQWGVPVSELRTAESVVIHDASSRRASYGSLATVAAALPPPDPQALVLKSRKAFRLLGRRHRGVDGPAIVTGAPLFGIDVQVQGQVVAVFQKCPRIYGRARSANLDEIRRLPGVTDAFIVEGTGKPSECLSGVAILARNTWSALAARRQLKVDWDLSTASADSWQGYVEQAKSLTAQPVGAQTVESRGDIEAAMSGGRVVSAVYTYGFVAHGQLEPQNATAWYRKDAEGERVEVWAPTQTPTQGRELVASVLGLPLRQVTLHQTRVGGGFGRRLVND
jgi:isoquinoline 1-oxidoreductase beta subunit